jgi:TPR repeat protein
MPADRRALRRADVLDQPHSDRTAGLQDASASAEIASATQACPGCGGMLVGLPLSARFCPQCGGDLQALRAASASGASAAMMAASVSGSGSCNPRPTSWSASLFQSFRFQPLPPPLPGETRRSLIVIGYARALFRLGSRYESGLGASRNTDEAHRCFSKAARLGDAEARARLTPPDEVGAPADSPPLL